MRTTFAIFAIGICANVSLAQQGFRLDLYLTARSIGSDPQRTLSDIGTSGVVTVSPGRYRVELRYFMWDLTSDMITSRGLGDAHIRFATLGGPVTLHRAPITQHEIAPIPGSTGTILNPDATGPADGMTGLIGAFRSGLMSDTDPGNPSPGPGGWSILPSAISAPDHLSYTNSCPPPAICNPDPARRFVIHAFEFDFAGNDVTFSASALGDPITGVRCRHYARNHSTGTTTLEN